MAKPFRFRLDKVLDYRRQLEDQAKLDLAEAQRLHDRQAARTLEVENALKRHLRKQWAENATAGELWLWRQYKAALEQDLVDARAELARLALKLQKCRQDLVQRSKERKLLETLKDKQAKRHTHEEGLREQKEYDELAALRHPREDV
ncbi:MAG: flagellar export protein FliJ [Desulfovibrionaceae bacterium]